ncbi:MAG: phosphoribosylamine--glycine ligase [Candidatus Berkelbacteria bacterium]|nr:phosphoribosylamine--glycine ligase [Candidatus Berkelbacteria bacterium]
MVVGDGAREHAFVWKLAQSPLVQIVFCAPGNGGTTLEPKCRNVEIASDDVGALAKFAEQEKIDLTVVGTEKSLIDGIVDRWSSELLICGPKASAAWLEGSKIFAKGTMNRFGIPTAPYHPFSTRDDAHLWLLSQPKDKPWVVKADGLTGGKGVTVCDNKEQTIDAIVNLRNFREAGQRFLVEERLHGREASLFLFCTKIGQVIPFVTAQDYKCAFDGDVGPNTGGMGSYSPASHLTPKIIDEVIMKVQPMVLNLGFAGFLYVGLMLTDQGWKVLEFNVRMGNPETQVVLRRLETDLLHLLFTAMGGGTWDKPLVWNNRPVVSVEMTSGGYPDHYRTGEVIRGLDLIESTEPAGVKIFHGGTRREGDKILTNGGRVLSVTALGPNLPTARDRAYAAVDQISWRGEAHRRDIAFGI